MGRRGPLSADKLKIAPSLKLVGEMASTGHSAVAPVEPIKPPAVRTNRDLNRLWDEVVPELDKAGLVSAADAPAIEMALRHFLLARRASNKLMREGLSIADKTHGGLKRNPLATVFSENSAAFLRYAQQLGMTFAGRARTPIAKGGGAGVDNDGTEGNEFAPSSG